MAMRVRDIFDKPVFKTEIVLCLAWARLLITVLPFRKLRPRLGPLFEPDAGEELPQLTPAQVKKARDTGRIIRRVAWHMPFRADCVPQAMTGRWMLARRGIPSHIMIGTRKQPEASQLEFQAWLMVGDVEVTGGDENATFQPFNKDSAATD